MERRNEHAIAARPVKGERRPQTESDLVTKIPATEAQLWRKDRAVDLANLA